MVTPALHERDITVYVGQALHVLRELDAGAADCIVTSPPYYGLRDYGVAGQLGHELTPHLYVEALVEVLTEARRVLSPTGTLWLNLGDSYSGKANGGASFDRHRGHGHRAGVVAKQRNTTGTAPYKSLLGIPWRVALALTDAGWTLRNDNVWDKPNAMPESVTDRLASRHEYVFLLSRGPRYWFDLDAVRIPHAPASLARYAYEFQPNSNPASATNHLADGGAIEANPKGRNPGDVWSIPTSPYKGAHYACMPPALARRCILAGCPAGGTVLDPYAGSGTTLMVARQTGRRSIGIDLDERNLPLIRDRIGPPVLDFLQQEATP